MNCRRNPIGFIAVSLGSVCSRHPSRRKTAMPSSPRPRKKKCSCITARPTSATARRWSMRSKKNIRLSNPSCCVSVAPKSLSKFSKSTAAAFTCSMSSPRPVFSSTKSSKKICFKNMNRRNGAPLPRTSRTRKAYWVSAYHNASVVAYNTNLLKPAGPSQKLRRSARSEVEGQNAHG